MLEVARLLYVLKVNTDCECSLNCKTFKDLAAGLEISVCPLTTLVRVCFWTSQCAICGGTGKGLLSPVLQFFSSFFYH